MHEKGIVFETVKTVEESLIGQYLVILYDGQPYPGVVLDVDEDDVKFKVFHFINIIYKLLFSKLNKSRSEPGNAPRIGIGHREVVCQKYL